LKDREQRDGLQAFLKEKGIPTMVYYPKPMHEQSAYTFLNYPKGASPVTEYLCDRVLSLPMHPYLTDEVIEEVCNAIKEFIH